MANVGFFSWKTWKFTDLVVKMAYFDNNSSVYSRGLHKKDERSPTEMESVI